MTEELMGRFDRCIQEQSFEKAFEVCAQAIRLDRTDWNALYLAGVTLRLRGAPLEAIAYYRNALDFAPDSAAIWQALGIAHQMLRQHNEAIDALVRAVRLDPSSYAAFNSLGITFKLAGDYASAMLAYQKALEVCANRAFADIYKQHPEFFGLEQRGDKKVFVIYRGYMDAMRQALCTDFDYFNTLKNMMSCCIERGDDEQAAQLQRNVDTCTPIDADIIGPIQPKQNP